MYRRILILISLCLIFSSLSHIAAATSPDQTLPAPQTLTNQDFGNSVGIDTELAVIGDVSSGCAHIYTRLSSTWSRQDDLKCDGTATGEGFGQSVAVSGTTIAVGAPQANSFTGQVYIGESGGLLSVITAPDGAPGDNFGYALDVDGDTLAIGATGADLGPDQGGAGAVYIYTRSNGNWTYADKLTLETDAASGDLLGWSVDMDGGRVIAGAVGRNNFRGAAAIFERDEFDKWSRIALLTANDGTNNDTFGYSVAISGGRAVVGAPADDGLGAAYFFTEADNWTLPQKVRSSGLPGSAQFGQAVAMQDSTAIIGAPGANAAYRYGEGSGGGWSQRDDYTASSAAGDKLGASVGLSNGTVMVGALDQNTIGAAYVYTFDTTPPQVVNTSPAANSVNTTTDANIDITFSEDVTTDGAWFNILCQPSGTTYTVSDAIITGSGTTRTIDPLTDFPVVDTCTVTLNAAQITDTGGFQLDGNGDGTPGDDYSWTFSAPNRGIDLGNGVVKLLPDNVSSPAQFGSSIDISGETIAIGTPGQPAAVFVRDAMGWVQQARLSPNDTPTDYGVPVSIDGDTVIVGADEAAYVFVRDGGGNWSQQQKLSSGTPGDSFGYSVTASGDQAAVLATDYVAFFDRANEDWTERERIALPAGETAEAVAMNGDTVAVSVLDAGTRVVYVLADNGSNWTQQARRTAGPGSTGAGVAIDSGRIVQAGAGGAYVFAGANWTQEARLTRDSNPVDISGERALIGGEAPYLYQRTNAGWGEAATFFTADVTDGDEFGVAVALGSSHAVIGAPGKNAAYIFDVSDFAPSVQVANPTPGVADVAVNTSINLVFSEEVTVSASGITIVCNTLNQPFALIGSGTNYALDPTANLPHDATCTVSINTNSVQDADTDDPPDTLLDTDGTDDGIYQFGFETETFTGPRISITDPTQNAENVLPTSAITLTFNKPVTFTGGTLVCGGNPVSVVQSGSGSSYALTPESILPDNAVCKLTIPAANATDTDGTPLEGPYTLTFSTGFETNIAPSITAITPDFNATDVPVEAAIVMTMSESVTARTQGVTFICDGGGIRLDVQRSGNTFTAAPVRLLPFGATCTLAIPTANITDADDNPLVDTDGTDDGTFTLTFTTETAPEILSISPIQLAANVPVTTNIVATFNEAVFVRERGISFICQPGNVRFRLRVSRSGLTYTANPAGDLPYDADCTLSIPVNSLQDRDGNVLIDTDGTDDGVFRLIFGTERERPRIVSTDPANGAVNVPVDRNVRLTLSESVSVSGGGYAFRCDGERVRFRAGRSGLTYTLTPFSDLPAGASCSFTIPVTSLTNAEGVYLLDNDGNPDGIYTLTFTTAVLSGAVLPADITMDEIDILSD